MNYPYKVEQRDTNNKWSVWERDIVTESDAIKFAVEQRKEMIRLGYDDCETRFVVISRESDEIVFDTHASS